MRNLNQWETEESVEIYSEAGPVKGSEKMKDSGPKMIPYEAALDRCLSEVQHPLAAEQIPVLDALGRTLRERIQSPHAFPPFSRSVMDGYAVRWKDVTGASLENPLTLEVIGDLPAGKKDGKRIGEGQAIRIMTGAPVPEGADAVVMIEDTECAGNRVKIQRDVKENENIAYAGGDLKQGEVILSQGVRIGPTEMGMLAACGRALVSVSQRPKIGILSTGNELAVPGTPCGAAQIYDVNGYVLFGLAGQAGAEAVFMGIAGDRYEALLQVLNGSGDFDILLISGGGSVGDYDIVQDALLRAGMRKVLWNTRINPGKPVFVGRRFRQLIFALPGNPISSMLNFLLLVRPVLDKMMGQKTPGLRTAEAVVLEELKLRPGQRKFIRARLEQINETIGVRVLPWQRSAGVHSMTGADALVEVPGEVEWLRKGDKVKIHHLN